MSTTADAISDEVIADVQIINAITRYPRTIGRNARLGSHGDGPSDPAIVLRTRSGAVGWGPASGRLENIDALVGRRLGDLIDPAVGVVDAGALTADIALHDLVGVLVGEPVFRLIGGRGPIRLPVYDGSIYFDDLDSGTSDDGIGAVLTNVRDGYQDGYRAFKLKIGRGNMWMARDEGDARDAEITRAVHEAFPDVKILVDANDGYTVDGFIGYLQRLGDLDPFWIEEPFAENRDDLARLTAWRESAGRRFLVAEGEFEPIIDDVIDLASGGLIDVLLMDVVSFGFSPWRRLAAQLEGSSALFSPHAWGTPLKTCYAAQLSGGLGKAVAVEGVRGSTVGVDASGYRIEDGMLVLPDTPGFGVPVPRESLRDDR